MTDGTTLTLPAPPHLPPSARLARQVGLALLGLVLLWTLAMGLLHTTPPWDNVEELVWSGSFEWGYYKHPPLPTWLLGMLTWLLGRQAWVTYAAGIGCAALALYFVWRWALDIVSPQRAAVAVLLGTAVAYHSLRAVIYNHNSVQLAPLAAYWWLLYRVLRPQAQAPRLWESLGLGLAVGLAVLTKYSAVFQLLAGLGVLVYSQAWRRAQVRQALLLAALVAAVLLAPHLWWVWQHPEQSLGYARHSMHKFGTGRSPELKLVQVMLVQLVRVLPLLALWGLVAWWRRREARPEMATPPARDGADFASLYLNWALWAPLALLFGLSALMRWPLSSSWPTTFFLPLSLWLVMHRPALAAERWTARTWRVFVAAAVALQLVAALGQGVGGGWLAQRARHAHRASFPAPQVAEQLQAIWQQHSSRPLTLIAGETWLSGAVALATGPQVQVLIDGNPAYSPWVGADALREDGVLVLKLEDPRQPLEPANEPMLDALMARASARGLLTLPWTQHRSAPQVRLHWAIVPPHAP